MKRKLQSKTVKSLIRFGCFSFVSFGLYGICISRWAGVNLRLNTVSVRYDLSNKNSQLGRFVLVNPTFDKVEVKVQPACGCVVVTDYPKNLYPFVPCIVVLEIHPDSLISKPGYKQRVAFECSDSRHKWTETVDVEPRI